MTVKNDLDMTLHLSHDEEARRWFIIACKQFVNFNMESGVRSLFDDEIEPKMEKELGRPLDHASQQDRELAKQKLEPQPMYRLWESFNYTAQGMMWDCIDEILDHGIRTRSQFG